MIPSDMLERGRKVDHVYQEDGDADTRAVSVAVLADVVSIVRTHWGERYKIGHYTLPAGVEAHGYVLFQIRSADGSRFVIGVNPRTGDWYHADTKLKGWY